MKTTIKRDDKNDLGMTMTMKGLTMGKLLTTLQALKDSKSPVAYDVYCSIRNAMHLSNDGLLRDTYKIFEDCQKEELTPSK